ncbi:hypothetical protein BG004_000951 [Podila humilis]|nr:hypothetical protein BG004_000951 [Podila humilis]
MPALVLSCEFSEAVPLVSPTLATKKLPHQHLSNHQHNTLPLFNAPELCDLIATHLSSHDLAIAVQVSSVFYAHFIRHLWKTVTLSGATSSTAASQAILSMVPILGHHIRSLDWANVANHWNMKHALEGLDLSTLSLQHLNLAHCLTLQSHSLQELTASSASTLASLRMLNIGKLQGDVFGIATNMPQLQHLTLVMDDDSQIGRRARSQPATPATPADFATPSMSTELSPDSGLCESTVTPFELTSADSLPGLMDACPRLHTIELIGVSLVSLPALQDDQSNDGESQLERLTLQSTPPVMQYLTQINLHSTVISGSTLSAIFSRCIRLTKLDLSQTSPLFITGFHLNNNKESGGKDAIILSDLSTLLLSGCHFLNGHGFKELFPVTPNLHTIELSDTNVDNTGLAALGRHCLQLQELNLNNCHQITDQGVRDYFGHPPAAAAATNSHTHSYNYSGGETKTASQPYCNYTLQCLSISNCTELTGQGIQHILKTCGALKSLAFQQPEIMPESMFPHELQIDEDDVEINEAPGQSQGQGQGQVMVPEEPLEEAGASDEVAITTATAAEVAATTTTTTTSTETMPSEAWACSGTLEMLRIKRLNVMNPGQRQHLNARLRELSQLQVLHIGGSQMELSVLNGLGHRLEHLYIDDLAREVNMEDVAWLVDHTPNLTRFWCRQLIRHSEPWKKLRGARKQLKLW